MFPIVAAILIGIVVFCLLAFVLIARAKKQAERADSVPQMNRRKEPRVPVTSEFDLFWQDVDA